MIRPWKVVLGVVLGVAALPSSAMAQDTTAPTVTVATPQEGAVYTQGDPVTASFSCVDETTATPECTGSVASGTAISTATVGNFEFVVRGKDAAGNETVVRRSYSVKAREGDVGGGAAATLNLTLGQPGSFAPFIPGVARDYTATMSANVLSTADNATLTVADASTTATGHMVNGANALQTPLNATATSTNQFATAAPGGPVGGTAAPTALLSYSGPVTNDAVALNFKQSIAGTEALRTGSYAKTLTFTLSTTAP